jgi:signal transduction histidine kinase
MSLSRSADVLARRQLILRATFALIIGLFVLSNLISLVEIVGVRSRNRLLLDNTRSSIELIGRIAHDVDRKRLLVGEHIAETAPADMAGVEASLAKLEADYVAAQRAYEPIANFTHEHETWERLQAAIAATQLPIARCLELSRQNQDTAARAVMSSLQPVFDEIDQGLDSLIRINREEGERTIAAARDRQGGAIFMLAGITIGGAVLALAVALWVSRILRRRDDRLREATALLEEQNRELDAFAGRVAHDLRGPLTTISLSAESLPEGDRAVAILKRGVARMEVVIRDLLALSRIDGQPQGAVAETATVATVLEEDLRPAVSTVHGALHVDVEPAEVACSDGLLRQVLWNLGENAVKYRRNEVELDLWIRGRNAGRSYEFRVSDNGAGMSADDAQHAFDPFFRSNQVRAIPGTGLGLSIVKRAVEATGGTVSIDSAPGRGTTFVINLPLKA